MRETGNRIFQFPLIKKAMDRLFNMLSMVFLSPRNRPGQQIPACARMPFFRGARY